MLRNLIRSLAGRRSGADLERLLEAAGVACDRGDAEEAEALARAAFDCAPTDPRTHEVLARALRARGREVAPAQALLAALAGLDPALVRLDEGHRGLGEAQAHGRGGEGAAVELQPVLGAPRQLALAAPAHAQRVLPHPHLRAVPLALEHPGLDGGDEPEGPHAPPLLGGGPHPVRRLEQGHEPLRDGVRALSGARDRRGLAGGHRASMNDRPGGATPGSPKTVARVRGVR